MVDALRLLSRYLGVSIRAQLQYRAAFWLQAAGQFGMTGIEFLGVWALFDRFGQLRGWSFGEVALFYGVVNVAFAVADSLSTGFDRFSEFVRAGDFDRILVRPRSPILQLAGYELGMRRVGRLLQGGLVFGYGVWASGLEPSPASVGLLTLAVLGGACLFYGLFVLQATISFWTTESLELMNTLTYGGVETAQYPLAIYARWFRRFFTFVVPLAAIAYFPVVGALGREDPLGSTYLFQCLAPLLGFAFLLACFAIFGLGTRHYTSTGS